MYPNDQAEGVGERLQPQHAAALKRLGRTRWFPRGALMFGRQQLEDLVVLILSGCARVTYTSASGREFIRIRTRGQLLAEGIGKEGEAQARDATALQHADVLVVPRPAFEAFLKKHADAEPWYRAASGPDN